MTYTFNYAPAGKYIIFDTASGAVIVSSELEAYICEALDPCGDTISLPDSCPSEIRYELARFSSTDVSFAYNKIKSYYDSNLIFKASDVLFVRTKGEHSADVDLLSVIIKETGLNSESLMLI